MEFLSCLVLYLFMEFQLLDDEDYFMKKEIRRDYLSKRNLMSKEEVIQKSKIIHNKLYSSKAYLNVDWIFTYINMGSEVETIPLIKRAWNDRKKVAVPIVVNQNRKMEFVELKEFDTLQKSKKGILEPIYQKEAIQEPYNKKVLFLVPGSVFDLSCNRFGYGGGYYDTYFEQYHTGMKIGLAFDFQIVKSLSVEVFDYPLDSIITECRWIGER